ncbi:unnamed protein product [Amoebophrya sp. A120]|nr:unnamed protein product [Amoebophrya sp. A120]|eukprot:GSA120T00006456001.1
MAPSVPREVQKWMQMLALTHTIKDAKFDLANGYLIAQMFQRYYPKDCSLYQYENGQSIHCRSNNWEMLFRLFKKLKFPCTREEFDEVLHHVDDAAVLFLCKVYEFLTGKKVVLFGSPQKPTEPRFAKHTASWKLKDAHLERIEDNIHRTIRRIQTLERHNDDLARDRIGPDGAGVRRFIALAKAHDTADNDKLRSLKSKTETEVTDTQGPVREQTVNAMLSKTAGMQSMNSVSSNQTTRPIKSQQTHTASVIANIGFHQPTGTIKATLDIIKPLILGELDKQTLAQAADSEELDPVMAFIEATLREALPEPLILKLFKEKLIARASLFIDSLLKSSVEFWKTWSAFLPLLNELPARSKVFESAMDFWKRVGELCKNRDEALTQKCMLNVCLPSLVQLMHADATKRETCCQLVYTFLTGEVTHADQSGLSLPRAVARLQALKTVKDLLFEKFGNKFVTSYVPCLACFVHWDCSPSQPLTDHLLDLYLYYALLALQMPQPRLRMAGLTLLTSIAGSGSSDAVLSLVASLKGLMYDSWWEVQAGLLLLVSTLLLKYFPGYTTQPLSPQNTTAVEDLLKIVKHVVNPQTASKNVLQVGLSYFSRNLHQLVLPPTTAPPKDEDGGEAPQTNAAVKSFCMLYANALTSQQAAFRGRLLPPECQAGGGSEQAGGAESSSISQHQPEKVQYVLGENTVFFQEYPLFPLAAASGGGSSPSSSSAKNTTSRLCVELAEAVCAVANGSGAAKEESEVDPVENAAAILHVPLLPLDRLEAGHLETIYALVKRKILDNNGLPAQSWVPVYDLLKKYLFVALLEPENHALAAKVLRETFYAPEAGQTRQLFIRNSTETFVSMYGLCLANDAADPEAEDGGPSAALVSEATLCEFVKSLISEDSELKSAFKNVFRYYKEQKRDEFDRSMLAPLAS